MRCSLGLKAALERLLMLEQLFLARQRLRQLVIVMLLHHRDLALQLLVGAFLLLLGIVAGLLKVAFQLLTRLLLLRNRSGEARHRLVGLLLVEFEIASFASNLRALLLNVALESFEFARARFALFGEVLNLLLVLLLDVRLRHVYDST